MKTTFTILALAFAASVLPSYADSTDAATQKPGAGPTFQFGQLTVALSQTNPAGSIAVSTDGDVSYCAKTGVENFTGNAKIIVTAPGQKPVTISGENLTVTIPK